MTNESWLSRMRRWLAGSPRDAQAERGDGELATWLQSTQETERAALARSLHDELGGLLTAARMDLSWLRSRLEQVGDDGMRQKAAAIDAGLSEAMKLKRGVVDRLRPALLDHFGLATALQAHCEDVCRRASVPYDIQVSEDISAMPPDLALALFRACEFALLKMLRTPPPRHVELIAEVDTGRLLLTLQASGLQGQSTSDALAVENFQHWMGRYGGTMSWADDGTGGARLTAEAPLGNFSAGGEPSGSRSMPAAR